MSASTSTSGATAVAAQRTPVTHVTPGMLLTGAVAVAAAAGLVILPEVSGFEGPGFFVAAPVCVVALGAMIGIISNRLLRT
ncbi:hypothetical protein P2H44_06085 [Albimonas sp. CAU 1670]|uniref:hypothetical protein n=1 Tax=Albimonas sp. CAU 1670 TaxID=3032599 RepID=UPI0023DC6BE8|nr:hypothetical protein [Albimonas sp. CAU 1670]MDF2232118.1 hypothetical protein [Albimonas sp. CAU 1670]